LIAPAFACIRNHKKAIIRGRDGIGSSLISLVKRFETDNLSEFVMNLEQWYQVEYKSLVDHGKEFQSILLTDKVETLKYIAAESKSIADMLANINILFDDTSEGIVFSSFHRAKGLEADRVFIMEFTNQPHPKAKQEWQIEQEWNAIYVALTRSKADLFLVEPKPKLM
jgi:superfamily I DNA/RNA helicase